jgi:toxin-antitoxin system PIN domain toxin
MLIPDINLLLYAVFDGLPEHAAAHAWLSERLNSDEELGLPLPVLFGFIRLSTQRRVFARPLTLERALGYMEAWLGRPNVVPLLPGPRHLEIAFSLFRELGAARDLTTDVQLAALAIEHQAELCSNDTDFGRFSGLRWVNPLGKARRR